MAAMIVVLSALVFSAYGTTVTLPTEDGVVDPDLYDEYIEARSGWDSPVVLMARDGEGSLVLAKHLLPEAPLPPIKVGERELNALSLAADTPGAGNGFLDTKGVYLSQCHGWIWYDSLGRFSTQRGNYYSTVEDFHNPEGMNQYLANYLENAGANVFMVKERDHNPEMALADNDGEGYSEKGSDFSDGPSGFGDQGEWGYGENPFSSGTTRQFPADGGSVVAFIPDVPADGHYAVYVAWANDQANATDAHYRIQHPGGTIDRYFDQTAHGSTWQYVETLWLEAGVDTFSIELIADSAESDKVLSADAVRIGGGMGAISRYGDLTGRPRWEEGAILAAQFNGAPSSVYDPYGDGDGSDPASRSAWAAWEHPAGEDALYLSWHSNAFDGTAYGTVTYSYEDSCSSGPAIDGSAELSQFVQDEMIESFTMFWDPDWYDRGTKTDCFSEVNPSLNPEMPAALVELAFHDNASDVAFILEPAFRRDASRAMYRGIVRYFASTNGTEPKFLPEPPVDLHVRANGAESIVISWSDNPDVGAPFGDAAESYRVYSSYDGKSWGSPIEVTQRTVSLDVPIDVPLFFKVTAVNDGGESFPSLVAGASVPASGPTPVLVVHAFDREDAGLLEWTYVSEAGLGDLKRLNIYNLNPFDAVVAHGEAIAAAGWAFDSVAESRVSEVDLTDYPLVIWAAGEESTVDESISSAAQSQLATYIDQGGALWVSGAEVLWDLDYMGSKSDKQFANEVLGVALASDDAETDIAAGVGLLAGLDLSFGREDGAPYPVEWPDEIESSAQTVVQYDGGGVAGVLSSHLFVLGYPFECIGDAAARQEMALLLLPALVPDYSPPGDAGEYGDDTGSDDLDLSNPVQWSKVPLESLTGCATTPTTAGWMLLMLSLVSIRRGRSESM